MSNLDSYLLTDHQSFAGLLVSVEEQPAGSLLLNLNNNYTIKIIVFVLNNGEV